MKTNFIKEWFNTIRYPVPKVDDNLLSWRAFAKKATHARIKKTLEEYIDKYYSYNRNDIIVSVYRDIIFTLIRGMPRKVWPKFSRRFIKENKSVIFRVSSRDAARQEVYNYYNLNGPSYLIDRHNQCLGIVVNKKLILKGVVNYNVDNKVAYRCKTWEILPELLVVEDIGDNLAKINLLLGNIGVPFIDGKYWTTTSGDVFIWKSMTYYSSSDGTKENKAGFIFFM